MIIAAGNNENFSFAKSIGVGLINSSINLTRLILNNNVQNLIFVGSAGSYDKNLQIGEIFYGLSAYNIEISFSENKSYTPLQNHIIMESFEVIDSKNANFKSHFIQSNVAQSQENTDTNNGDLNNQKILQPKIVSYETLTKTGLKCKAVNSSNYISTDENFAKKMTNINIALENMEFFSILSVAQHFHIPCVGIFCVSNYCDENAHRDFIKNHDFVKNELEIFVKKNILLEK